MISADTFSLPERTLITMISYSFSFKYKLGESHTLYATAALAYQAIAKNRTSLNSKYGYLFKRFL